MRGGGAGGPRQGTRYERSGLVRVRGQWTASRRWAGCSNTYVGEGTAPVQSAPRRFLIIRLDHLNQSQGVVQMEADSSLSKWSPGNRVTHPPASTSLLLVSASSSRHGQGALRFCCPDSAGVLPGCEPRVLAAFHPEHSGPAQAGLGLLLRPPSRPGPVGKSYVDPLSYVDPPAALSHGRTCRGPLLPSYCTRMMFVCVHLITHAHNTHKRTCTHTRTACTFAACA